MSSSWQAAACSEGASPGSRRGLALVASCPHTQSNPHLPQEWPTPGQPWSRDIWSCFQLAEQGRRRVGSWMDSFCGPQRSRASSPLVGQWPAGVLLSVEAALPPSGRGQPLPGPRRAPSCSLLSPAVPGGRADGSLAVLLGKGTLPGLPKAARDEDGPAHGLGGDWREELGGGRWASGGRAASWREASLPGKAELHLVGQRKAAPGGRSRDCGTGPGHLGASGGRPGE